MELRREYTKFQNAEVEIAALAVAPLSAVNNGVRKVIKPPYPLLADPKHRVAEAYGVYNLLGDQLAAPSVFIIDTGGRVVWSHVGQSPGDRPDAQTILKHLP